MTICAIPQMGVLIHTRSAQAQWTRVYPPLCVGKYYTYLHHHPIGCPYPHKDHPRPRGLGCARRCVCVCDDGCVCVCTHLHPNPNKLSLFPHGPPRTVGTRPYLSWAAPS